MSKIQRHFKMMIGGFMFFAVFLIGMRCMRESVYALGDVSRYHTEFINQACPNIKVIGRAYLVGPDNVAHRKNHIAMDVVPAGTKIQGKTVDPKYLPQDNIENLKVLYSSVIGYQNFTWINGAYLESETANLQVVAYDKYTVTFWSNGYKSFTGAPVMCAQYLLQASHPPGFYRTSRNNVWIDLDKEYNRIPEGTNIKYVAEGKVTCGFIGISPIPGTADSGDVYRVGINKKIYIVTTRRLYSNTPDTDDLYYKVIFQGDNSTNYLMNGYGYYYVKSKYINLYKNGTKVPNDAVMKKVYNLKTLKEIGVRKSKDESNNDNVVGFLQANAEIETLPKESDSNWTTVWFNSERAYVRTQYLTDVELVENKTKVKNLLVSNVKNNQYVLSWSKSPGCTGYNITYTGIGKNSKAFFKKTDYKKTSITVNRSYFKNNRNTILVNIAANYKTGATEATQIVLSLDNRPPKMKKKRLNIKKKQISFEKMLIPVDIVQYSTNKSFKNAKTVWDKKGGGLKAIKKLKPNTTYYIRYSITTDVSTLKGYKKIGGIWSKTIKVKTKK